VTPERWRDVQRLFHEARGRPRTERAAFVSGAAAGDAELEAEVASLLASADTDEGFLETPARPPPEAPRSRIGPYDVMREIGHGGMGTVYLAMRADEQFKKRVAIKVVRRGMDTEAVLRRFRQERQILAGLDHPNIARLLDGGNTDDGLPYLVMEHVEGEPVTAWCVHRGIGAREKIVLFRTICAAVHFAHQNLVVHRDLKPGNILVAADGAPKLLDFGVAKLLNPEVSGQTLDLTGASVRVFTPEYASPEQIRGERITTATDVYALGVLLHEILTGRRPEAEPGRTKRTLPADLDTIVGMATRPEPARRYASAEQLSEDLRRYLEGLPVKARRDTFSYRTGKFLSRHKAGAAAAALVVLSLVGGILATARQARIARAERARADRRFEDVRKLASSFLFEFHDSIRNLPGSTPARELLVRRALEYLGTLSKEAGNDPVLQRDLAEAYEKLADVQGVQGGAALGDSAGALSSMKTAVQIRERLVAVAAPIARDRGLLAKTLGIYGAALSTTGDIGSAVAASRRAVELLEGVVREAPRDPEFRRGLADAHFFLSNRLSSADDREGTVLEMRRALATYESLLVDAPRDVRLRRAIALCHKYIASSFALPQSPAFDPAVALAGYEKSLTIEQALLAEDPTNALLKRDLSHSFGGCGESLFRLGRVAEGAAAYGKAIALRVELTAADPKNMGIRQALARAHMNLAENLTASGNPLDALVSLRRAQPMLDDVAAKDPSNAMLASEHATLARYFGEAHAANGNVREARQDFDRAVGEYERLKADGHLPASNEIFLRDAITGRARCEAALASQTASKNPKSRPSQ
jgi:eukaryotic-like serine/threonine-protein kinase